MRTIRACSAVAYAAVLAISYFGDTQLAALSVHNFTSSTHPLLLSWIIH